jgi:hypothetical protein
MHIKCKVPSPYDPDNVLVCMLKQLPKESISSCKETYKILLVKVSHPS